MSNKLDGLESCITGMLPFGAKFNQDIRVVRGNILTFTVDAGYRVFTFLCDSNLSTGEICDKIHDFMTEIKSNL